MGHRKKIVIIGAGPAGLSCGLELSKSNYDVIICEAGDSVGGMSKSIELWGQIVDLGPHRFFSKNPMINEFFKETVKNDYTLVNRLTRIYYNKSFFNYPLKIFNVLKNLDIITIVQILYYYAISQLNRKKELNTFEDWIVSRFGKKLFEIFFKNYSEKLWGISCKKIDADWAAQRIKGLSLIEAIISALGLGIKGEHATLVDQFAYPNQGTGSIYANTVKLIEANGGKVILNSPVSKIITEGLKATGIELVSGERIEADEVISTMPLTLMLKGLTDVPTAVTDACSKLYFRNTTLVYLEVEGQDLFSDNWIYVHEPDILHGRITNFRNWSPGITKGKKNSILCLEYWSFDEDDLWKADDQYLGDLASEELKKLALVPADRSILNTYVHRVKRCYPVYETGYQDHIDVIKGYLVQYKNLTPIGRYGSFKYNNQDHSILMGLLCAEKIIKGIDKRELWSINTDTEYQEDGTVKDVLIG